VWKSGLDYTDIVKLSAHRAGLAGHLPAKCDGEFFLKHAKLKFVRGLKITMRYLQLG